MPERAEPPGEPPALEAGRWQIVRPLGEGGVGSVWLGVDRLTGETAAVKFTRNARASRDEFRREASIAQRNRHPNLVRVLDAGTLEDGTPWLALEFVDGEDLRTQIERAPLAPEEGAQVVAEVFAALDALHRAGFVHGDVKPENVLLSRIGGQRRVALADFGRARLRHVYDEGGVFPGTPPYMHPSLFHGGPPTATTDCFAAWVMLCECVAGHRPYAARQLADAGRTPAVPLRRRGLANAGLDRLAEAGLTVELADARAGWLALTRFRAGRSDVPRPLRAPPEPPPELVKRALELARSGLHTAFVGGEQIHGRALGEAHRDWVHGGGTALWARAGWGEVDRPLSGALSLVSHAAEALDGPELARIAGELGPHGGVLASVAPAVRAWVDAAPRPATGEALDVALRAFCAACPRPTLILAEGLHRMDGTSRRFFSRLALSGVVVIGSAAAGAPHGLGREVMLPELVQPAVDLAWLDDAGAELARRADVLGLPYGPRLAVAAGLLESDVQARALEAEAVGAALWTGVQVLPRSAGAPDPIEARRFFREAAQRLDPAVEPLLVARYAALAGDAPRLGLVLDAAVREALTLDPTVALDLLRAGPWSPARLLQTFHVAVLARDMDVAAELLGRIAAEPSLSVADRTEAEAEFAFRTGQIVLALEAYRRVAGYLGRPLHFGVRGVFADVAALWRLWRDRPAPPRPDARLARVFERLHDLHFTEDNAPMLRIHALWREAAPLEPRVRAMDVVWNVAFGRKDRAMRVHDTLWAEVAEHDDPTGAAVILLHRAIARSWTGDVADSHSDAIDASERLLRVGDPYLAALAVGTVAVCSFHLGDPGPLARLNDRLADLVRHTGDTRAAAWVTASRAQVAWMQGRPEEALLVARQWVDEADARRESTSVLARRFLGELMLEGGAVEDARGVLLRAWADRERFHMQMDFTDAVAIDLLVVDARARAAGGEAVPGRRRLGRAMATLVGRSPRWRSRALVAAGWQLRAVGRAREAQDRFAEAQRVASGSALAADVLWAMQNEALALGHASDSAELYARAHGLRMKAS